MRRDEILRDEVRAVDLGAISSVADIVVAMDDASFQARALGQVARIWEEMLREDVTVFIGLSGAMIAGGLRKVIVDLLRRNMADVVVSTGAILYQDLYQSLGHRHYRGSVDAPDVELHSMMIDRIYDTYVDEEAFRALDMAIGRRFAREDGTMGTREFVRRLAGMAGEPGSILATAAELDVPVYCPAIADSSIGIGLAVVRHETGRGPLIDTIQDTMEVAQLVAEAGTTGAIYLGGGVPKNYINDAIVAADMMFPPVEGHAYAVQITTDRPDWGGLSGSTLREMQSWGKISARATKAMAFVDLTIGLPLVAGYLLSREIDREPRRLARVFG